jgi:medium-chain acyl-[acyl-carrier-protein] hydrolase
MTSGAGTSACPSRPGDSWFPFGTASDAPVRLLCLPHAGAGASVYRTWGRGLPAPVTACPVQPPGRERRLAEPPVTSVRELARQLAPHVIAMIRAPYAIFGHSTGALSAFEVSREIRRLGAPLPVRLFVAGRRAPSMPMPRTELAGLPPDELAIVLRRLDGTPEDILQSPAMLRLLQPLLAADFQVNEDYAYRHEPPLPIPITTFASTRDPFAAPEDVVGWQAETAARCTPIVLDGGHFAIFQHAAAVLRQIARDLAPWS